MKLAPLFAVPVLLAVSTGAHAQTDAQTLEAAQKQSSLACPDYSTERGAAIKAVPVDALRVLARHRFTLCPDRRVQGDMAVIWYPMLGVFAWNPGSDAAAKALVQIVDRITRLDDFPQGLTVWNASDEELTHQVVPEFSFRPTYKP